MKLGDSCQSQGKIQNMDIFSFLHPREGEERGIKVIGGKQGVQKGIMDTVKEIF